MRHSPIQLSALRRRPERSKAALITQLTSRGFALLELDIPARAEAIQGGLSEASALGGFRFPPINVDEVRYQEVHRAVFTSLYETAIDSLSPFASEALDELAELDRLFSASPHEPFPREHLFHPTFFNLFNYDHGSLNSHQDRGLLTVIHVEPPQLSARPHSALWVEGPDQRWRDADRALLDAAAQSPESTFALLLLGEEGEALLSAQHEGLYAAEHAVRVDPEGGYLERSHHQRDPAAEVSGNRRSAALILRATHPERCL